MHGWIRLAHLHQYGWLTSFRMITAHGKCPYEVYLYKWTGFFSSFFFLPSLNFGRDTNKFNLPALSAVVHTGNITVRRNINISLSKIFDYQTSMMTHRFLYKVVLISLPVSRQIWIHADKKSQLSSALFMSSFSPERDILTWR